VTFDVGYFFFRTPVVSVRFLVGIIKRTKAQRGLGDDDWTPQSQSNGGSNEPTLSSAFSTVQSMMQGTVPHYCEYHVGY